MLLRQTLLYLPAQLLSPLFQFIAIIVWTHVTDQRTLGVVTLITATQELLQTALLAWWSHYALRFLGRFDKAEGRDRFLRTESVILYGSTVLQAAVMLGAIHFVIAPDAGAMLIAASMAYTITRSLNFYLGERARGRQQILLYSIQQISGPTFGFVAGLTALHLFGSAPEWPLAGFALVQGVAAACVLPLMGVGQRLGRPDRAILDEALHYGLPLIIGGVLSGVALNAPRFAVNELLGIAAAGIFAVGYGLGQRVAAVSAMLVTAAAYPIAVQRMEEGNPSDAMRQLANNGALLAAILAPSVTGLFALRHEIVGILVAPAFQAGTLSILPLAVTAGAIRSFRSHFGDQIFMLHKRTRLSLLIPSTEAVLAVVLSFVLVAWYGLVGGALASVAATLCATFVSFWLGLTRFGLVLPYGDFVRVVAASLVMALALQLFTPATTPVGMGLHVLAGMAIYCVCLAGLYPRRMRRVTSRA